MIRVDGGRRAHLELYNAAREVFHVRGYRPSVDHTATLVCEKYPQLFSSRPV